MEAIILAGGFGTRLRGVVPDLPKPMAPINGKPFLEIILSLLARHGFTKIILSVGFMADKIIDHFGQQFLGMDIIYAQEPEALGTGGGVRFAMQYARADHTYIFNGDTYLDLEFTKLESYWQAHRCPIIVGRHVDDTARYGKLVVAYEQALGFAEKGASGPGLINAGCYVFNHGQLEQFKLQKHFSLEQEYLAHVVKTERIDVFVTGGMFIDIGVPEDYLRAQTELS